MVEKTMGKVDTLCLKWSAYITPSTPSSHIYALLEMVRGNFFPHYV